MSGNTEFEDYAQSLPDAGDVQSTDQVVVSRPGSPNAALKAGASQLAMAAVLAGTVAAGTHYHDIVQDVMDYFAIMTGHEEMFKEPVVLDTNRPSYFLSSADVGSIFDVRAANGYVDCEGIEANVGPIDLDVRAGASLLIWQGQSGTTIRGSATGKVLVPASSTVRIYRFQTEIVVTLLSGGPLDFTTTSAIPVPNKTICIAGQSWAFRSSRNAMRDLQKWLYDNGIYEYWWPVQGAAYGAAGICKGSPTVTYNYFWDQDAGVAGPRLVGGGVGNTDPGMIVNIQTALAAYPNGPAPAVSAVIWLIGVTDLAQLGTGAITTTTVSSSLYATIQYIRTQLSDMSMKHYVVGLNAWEDNTNIAEWTFYAMRRALMNVIDLGTNIYQGPEIYDIPLLNRDGHQSKAAQSLHGMRIAMAINYVETGTNRYQGPSLVSGSFTRVTANRFKVTMDRYGGHGSTGLSVTAPSEPFEPLGFGIFTAGDLSSARLTILSYEYDSLGGGLYDIYFNTAEDLATPDLAYPDGNMYVASLQYSRLVSARDRTLETNSQQFALRTFGG